MILHRKEVCVKITPMDNKERNEQIMAITMELLDFLNQEVTNAFVEDIESEENNQVMIGLTVSNPALLIGFKGKNLAALQLLLALMVKNKLGTWIRILVDINDYRNEQKERLESMAKNCATKAIQTGRPVSLATMSSYERRICHMVLQEIEGIEEESVGEGEERHIVVKPAGMVTE